MRKLHDYVNTLWKHTPKAVRKGEPANRVFAVVAVAPCDDGSPNWQRKEWLHAWKCTINADGKLIHPAYDVCLDDDDPRIFTTSSSNGSEPTAVFRPDSFYEIM